MRFDDSLDTVLSAETATPFGAQSAWRQLVDLIGRRRVPADARSIERLQAIRPMVPPPVRAASARALAFANPPAALVRLFFDDEIAIAAPVLRVASLKSDEWLDLLPGMAPASRSVLRHRRDLPADVVRALDTFGATDFRLGSAEDTVVGLTKPEPETGADSPSVVPRPEPKPAPVAELPSPEPEPEPDIPLTAPVASPFVSVGSVALGMPVVAEAFRRSETETPSAEPSSLQSEGAPQSEGTFQIAELVARIDAYQKKRDDTPGVPLLRSDDDQPALFDLDPVQSPSFRFETDAAGVMRWIEGAARAPLISLSLDLAALPSASRVDGIAAGAFRRRAGFADARLLVDGNSDAAGEWRITGIPAFDRASGRFTGYRGTARRPRMDESAAPLRSPRNPASDVLRQLVHELRTPTNAIAGFAEMIETQLLGPVPEAYRDQAGTIRRQTADLLTAIDDIDLAARLEAHALDLRTTQVPLAPLLARVASDLAPLATLRGAQLLIDPGPLDLAVAGDDRAIERLIGRLMSTLVASGGKGETITLVATPTADAQVSLAFDRPKTLAAFGDDALLTIDAETVAEADGAPLLGTGFALRLARNLAAELGGALTIDAHRLTLRLPAASGAAVGQVSSS